MITGARRRPHSPRLDRRSLRRRPAAVRACPRCRRARLRGRNWAQFGSLVTSVVAVTALVFTALSLRETRRQVDVATAAQLAERFTKAVDQTGRDQLDIRLGGTYALERIAHDSPPDRATVGRVLSAFVRHHRPLRREGGLIQCEAGFQRSRLDVAAALDTVLGIGAAVDLARSCLDGAELPGAGLRCANLSGVSSRERNARQSPWGRGRPVQFTTGDRIPTDNGRRYYRWVDPDTGDVGAYECLEPGGTFGTRRGKSVTWTDVGACPGDPA
ncbi:hypothetical protein ACQPZF_36945 [Actinosynnema sp. CS-041913]|uniref:hypothetical protein n=1 Tax=Actinosynnema sp. CS-041913 TaxID=3239917 RepID=UPI003D93670F